MDDQRRDPGLPRVHAFRPRGSDGLANAAVREPDDRHGVDQGSGDQRLEPGGEVVRVHEGARHAPGEGGRSRDPEDPAVAGRLRQEPQAGEKSAGGEQGEQQPIEDHRACIFSLDRRAPGIGNGDEKRPEPDRQPAELRPDTVGVDGEGSPERPTPAARPAGEHLGVQVCRGGRDQPEHRRRQGQGRRHGERDETGERDDARGMGCHGAPPPCTDRDREQHEDHCRGDGHCPGLAPAQTERQPDHERLKRQEHLAVDVVHDPGRRPRPRTPADHGGAHAGTSGGGW